MKTIKLSFPEIKMLNETISDKKISLHIDILNIWADLEDLNNNSKQIEKKKYMLKSLMDKKEIFDNLLKKLKI